MLPARIALVSQSASVAYADLVRVAQALNLQVNRDLAPIWDVSGTVMALDSPDRLDPGLWPVYIVDEVPEGTAGFHLTEHNQPYAIVQSGATWSLSASHETLEMLVDPSGNRLTAANAVKIVNNEVQDGDGKVEYLVEICDPSEDPAYAYLIDEVLVSDFYTPHFFEPAGTSGARYSFSGRISRPRQVLPNGYLTWFDPQTHTLRQVRHFGAPEIVDLAKNEPGAGSLTGGRSLRSFVDAMTPPPRCLSQLTSAAPAVERRDARRAMFAMAAPARGQMFSAALESAKQAAADAAANRQAEAGTAQAALDALAANRPVFANEGVLSVRAGLSWPLPPAAPRHTIVVTAQPDQVVALRAQLPATLDNVPVEVRAANAMEEMRVLDPGRYLAIADARHELRQPDFDGEVFFDGKGNAVQDHPAPLTAFATARAHKEQIPYTPAPEATLDEVTAPVTLVLHASPDAGWSQLSNFIAGVREELVVGMYDFTSAHILTAVEDALAGGKKLTLTLDHPAKNHTADQTDEETQHALHESLGGNFAGTWALTNSDPKAPVWIYPNAYHIKVAVREDDTFWLSSGNWNNSNQPEIDLSDPASARKIAAVSDRDWHVIAASPKLAETFRAFLQHDFDIARENIAELAAQAAGARAAMEQVLQQGVPVEMFAAGKAPQQFFTPRTLTDTIRIQPLLTPDNYSEHVEALIASAKRSFYMQTQYIHPSGHPDDEKHDALIAAVKDLIDRGLDVRLITSEYQTDAWVDKLVQAGIPSSVLRRQANVHNKGIVVDGDKVMVSSQNWSADGTLRNRDAGLIIYHADAAAYFQQIFLHDWNFLASTIQG
ncbi:phospholipase D-like domain-containing protein [Burkholderia sp. Bp8963]|uniref:phospholipase D-like domain-containing protein n=1 Tax=Burkholderia sp. Bp8963 TaxID=2184547 RepID=UPI00163AA3F9|nr:phospholipase D-like domain-containing protein [Burkholderia sp. Bp8963]